MRWRRGSAERESPQDMAKRIVIVTPGQLGSNPRVVKEADALHQAGYDVQVIATKVMDFVEPRDQAVMAKAPWPVERLPFDDRARWRRLRLRQEAARRLRRIIPSARLDALAQNTMAVDLAKAALRYKADLYIAHYPVALQAAAQAARAHGALYAFDAEDFHTGDLPDTPENKEAIDLIAAIEERYLPGTAYVTAASPGIARAYADRYSLPQPTTILNVFDAAPEAQPTEKGSAEGPSLYWFSQVIGPDRGLETAVEAIAIAQSRPHLYLRGTPQKGYAERIMKLAEDVGCAHRLHLLEPEAPHRMEELAAQYDLGLASETGQTLNRQIALTNKQFTYLAAGVPAVMSDIPAHREFAQEAEGAAFLYEAKTSKALASVLDNLFLNPERLAAARMKAYRLGQNRFNWAVEAPRLLNRVSDTIGLAQSTSSQP